MVAMHSSPFSPQDFVQKLLKVNVNDRLNAAEALDHPWIRAADEDLVEHDLNRQRSLIGLYQVKRKMRASIYTVRSARQ